MSTLKRICHFFPRECIWIFICDEYSETSSDNWNGKVVRLTALAVTGDVKGKLQRFLWRAGQSTWRPFRFNGLLTVWSNELPTPRTRGSGSFPDVPSPPAEISPNAVKTMGTMICTAAIPRLRHVMIMPLINMPLNCCNSRLTPRCFPTGAGRQQLFENQFHKICNLLKQMPGSDNRFSLQWSIVAVYSFKYSYSGPVSL